MSILINESKVEHWFGDINQHSHFQGNSIPKKDWEEQQRKHALDFIIRICETPFQQMISSKKVYQNVETLKVSTFLPKKVTVPYIFTH